MRHKWRRRAMKRHRIQLAALKNVTATHERWQRYGMGAVPLQQALKKSAQPALNYLIQERNARSQLAMVDYSEIERRLLAMGYTVEIDY